jgi:VWFA-related protein
VALPSAAQTSGPAAGADSDTPTPQAHVSLDTVSVNLVAHDKKKRPILNLTAADLSVTDAGVPVQLTNLHLVTLQSGGTADVALIFDRMSPESSKAARDIATKLLSIAPSQCSFAVFGVDRGLRLLEDFTPDRAAAGNAVQAALADLPPQDLVNAEKQLVSITQNGKLLSGANASVEERAHGKFMLAALEDSQRVFREQQVPAPLAGMLALAKAEQALPGRKIIVFFSDGLRSNAKMQSITQEIVEAANRTEVSIYTVDANGVDAKSFDMLTMMYQPVGQMPARLTPGVAGMTVAPNMSRIETMQSTEQDAHSISSLAQENAAKDQDRGLLTALAVGTGGLAISAGDKLNDPLKRLVNDLGTYYQADYLPTLKQYDGQFHALAIQPVRDGMTVRSGAGYYALPPDAISSMSVRPFEAPLLKLIDDPGATSALTFKQAVLCLGRSSDQMTDELTMEVPASDLTLREDRETLLYTEHLSILAQIKDKTGVVVQRFSQDYAHNGALETIEKARTEKVLFERHFTVAPGEYVLEAVVYDDLGAKAGIERLPFTVAAPADGPWISDVALVGRTEPLAGSPDPLDPMEYGMSRVIPSLSEQVPAGAGDVSFFFSTQADPSHRDLAGKLDVEIAREGNTVSLSAIDLANTADSYSSMHLATLSAKSFRPGAYHALIGYSQAGKTATRELMFTVGGADTGAVSEDADEDTTADVPESLDTSDGHFVPVKSSSDLQPPSQKFRDDLLDGARQRALTYLASLVNFKCIEVTERFVDRKGAGTWSRHDKIAELVTYENREESRRVLEVNGSPDNTQPADLKSARLEGEFGGVLEIVFEPTAKAQFEWSGTGSLDGAPVQVFNYTVDVKNSKFSVTPLPQTPKIVGFHGKIYIDAATRGVRRVTMDADGIPADSPVHSSGIVIDYDYVSINNHEYLMPVRGEMRMQLGKTEKIFHRIEFRDYHRFGSEVKIIGVEH